MNEEEEEALTEHLHESMNIFSSTDNQSDLLVASEVIYCHSLPEFPHSTDHGVAYVVDVKCKSNKERGYLLEIVCRVRGGRVSPLANKCQVQWAKGLINSKKKTINCVFFNGAPCQRKAYKCSGVRLCSKVPDEIKHQAFTSIEHDPAQQRLNQIRQMRDDPLILGPRKTAAYVHITG
jgi:hypothetical protein